MVSKRILISFLFFLLISFVSCEKEPDARDSVLGFVKELRTSNEIDLEKYLIVNEVVRENAPNVYIYDSSLSISENIAIFSGMFAPEGKLRQLWTSKQIVVGESEVLGDTAYVEVSFIDRSTNKQYYNKMGLRRTDTGWIIFAFKLL